MDLLHYAETEKFGKSKMVTPVRTLPPEVTLFLSPKNSANYQTLISLLPVFQTEQ
jgi:hypothetical protein